MRKKTLLLLLSSAAALTMSLLAGTGGTAAETVSLPVVMYHHISEDSAILGPYVISPEELESDLRWLQENEYTSVTAEDLLSWQKGYAELPEKPVMITFDDGYESTLIYAQPLLKKYNMRGVVAVIGSVAQQYTVTEDHHVAYSHLNWKSLREMAADGTFEIQCHTWDMHRLEPRRGCCRMQGESEAAYHDALAEDLIQFRDVCTRELGFGTDVLVIPYGAFTPETLAVAEELGFRCVFTCEEKINQLTGQTDELMRIGRFNRPSGPESEAFFSKWDQRSSSSSSVSAS